MKSIFAVLFQLIEKRSLAKIEAYERGLNREASKRLISNPLVAQFD